MSRHSSRLHGTTSNSTIAPPYLTPPPPGSTPFLALSPELHDHILSFLLLPASTPTTRRALAHSLLGLCRALTPLVRRRVFHKVGLTVDDPNSRDLAFLTILRSHAGVGLNVRSLRLRAPTPPEPLYADITTGGPGAALVPLTTLPPTEVLKRVVGVLRECSEVSELEVELGGCGMGVEDEVLVEEEGEGEGRLGGSREGWKQLEEVLKHCSRVSKLVVAVAHPNLKLQVMAQASTPSAGVEWAAEGEEEDGRSRQAQSYISPWLPALASWAHLTHLDLWRIRLQFPRSLSSSSSSSNLANFTTTSSTPSLIPNPLFSLQQLQVQSSELGGRDELLWLFGGGGTGSEAGAEAERKRGAKLQKLLFRDVEFLDTPGGAEPLLAIFPCPSSSSSFSPDDDDSNPNPDTTLLLPAFAFSLTALVLILPHPILPSSPPNDSRLSHFFTPLTSLRQVELGGPGVTLPLLQSLFTSPSSPPRTGPPAARVQTLNLSYTPSLPITCLLSLLSPSPSPTTSASSHAHLPKLTTLDILRAGTHPRTWTWERISSTPTPIWSWTEGEWRSLERVVRGIRDARRRSLGVGVGEGGGGAAGAGVGAELRLCRDGAEVEISYDSAHDSSSSSSEEEEDEETDGEALFEPSSEPGEGVGAGGGWAREESVESEW